MMALACGHLCSGNMRYNLLESVSHGARLASAVRDQRERRKERTRRAVPVYNAKQAAGSLEQCICSPRRAYALQGQNQMALTDSLVYRRPGRLQIHVIVETRHIATHTASIKERRVAKRRCEDTHCELGDADNEQRWGSFVKVYALGLDNDRL